MNLNIKKALNIIYYSRKMRRNQTESVSAREVEQELGPRERAIRESEQLFKELIQTPSRYQPFVNKCQDLYYNVIKMRKNQFADQIVDYLNSSFNLISNDPKNSGKSITRSTKLLIPVIIKESQEKYLTQFMKVLKKKIIQVGEKQSQGKTNPETALSAAKKINLYSFQNINKVGQIAIHLRKKVNEVQQSQDLHILISDQITDLSFNNINLIEQALRGIKCVLILPTLQNFYKYQNLGTFIQNTLINPVNLMMQKQLFCKFWYECICDQNFKAYLPKQSLILIDQFKKPKTTYKEAAHRLIYIMDRLEILRQQNSINFDFVDIHKLFTAIKKPLSKPFCYFYNQSQDMEQYIRLILNQNEKVSFLSKYISGMKIYLKQMHSNLSDEQIVSKIRQMIKESIQKQEEIKHLATSLNVPKQVQQSPKKPRSKKNNQIQRTLSQKVLEAQIRQMIDIMAQKIRNYAKTFAWSQYHFIQNLKAMLPFSMYDSIAQLSKTHHEIIQFIYQKPRIFLVQLIQKFCVQGTMDSQDLMSYVKDLQLQGLIQNTKVDAKTVINSLYFEQNVQKRLNFN